MPRIIWSRPDKPSPGVARALGISETDLGDAIHILKDAAGLGPRDRVRIWDDGSVTDDRNVLVAISTTKSKPATVMAYASLRFLGDRLEPDRVTSILGVSPTLAYRKGEVYKRSRGQDIIGRSGLWLLTTRRRFDSLRLQDHFGELLDALFPEGSDRLIEPLRMLMKRDGLKSDVTCFWYGEHGATPPEIPEETRAAFARIGATIETDFQTD